MRYRSIADMTDLITRNLHLVPHDVDLIVGIPRSGILPAITISLMLNLRYADLDSYVDGRLPGAGSTKCHPGLIDDARKVRHILVIDDSLNTGTAMLQAKERLKGISNRTRVTFAALYVVPDARKEVDVFFETLPLPRMFEWNFMHHAFLARACVNIDGVLCHTPSVADGKGSPSLSGFRPGTQLLYRPTRPIACLVTGKAEEQRSETEEWLEENAITYEKLVMLDLPSRDARRAKDLRAREKGEFFRNSKEFLFIESDHDEAVEIARISGKSVLSITRQEMINPSAWSSTAAAQKIANYRSYAEMSGSAFSNREALKRKLRRILPGSFYGLAQLIASRARGSKAKGIADAKPNARGVSCSHDR